jgi:hypothetical protein
MPTRIVKHWSASRGSARFLLVRELVRTEAEDARCVESQEFGIVTVEP